MITCTFGTCGMDVLWQIEHAYGGGHRRVFGNGARNCRCFLLRAQVMVNRIRKRGGVTKLCNKHDHVLRRACGHAYTQTGPAMCLYVYLAHARNNTGNLGLMSVAPRRGILLWWPRCSYGSISACFFAALNYPQHLAR